MSDDNETILSNVLRFGGTGKQGRGATIYFATHFGSPFNVVPRCVHAIPAVCVYGIGFFPLMLTLSPFRSAAGKTWPVSDYNHFNRCSAERELVFISRPPCTGRGLGIAVARVRCKVFQFSTFNHVTPPRSARAPVEVEAFRDGQGLSLI